MLFVLSITTSCNDWEKKEKLADIKLKKIESLIHQNALNSAKIEIDSLHLLFPKLISKRKVAAALEDTILRIESSRTLAYCDSLLPKKQLELNVILKNFRLEKNAKYQEIGNYIYKTQITESIPKKTYLKTYVDEKADLFLISNYCGPKIDHSCVEASNGDITSRTDTLLANNSANYSFTDGENHWETLTFKNDAANPLASFITQESDKQIKVNLCGKKRYTYFLSNSDKKAITETYRLWIVKKDIHQLEKEIKKAKNRIARINNNKK